MSGQMVVSGPNDFHLGPNGQLNPGLGQEEEDKIRAMRGFRPEPPGKEKLREQAEGLAARAKQLSMAERELAKEKKGAEEALSQREAALAEREALVAAHLKQMGVE